MLQELLCVIGPDGLSFAPTRAVTVLQIHGLVHTISTLKNMVDEHVHFNRINNTVGVVTFPLCHNFLLGFWLTVSCVTFTPSTCLEDNVCCYPLKSVWIFWSVNCCLLHEDISSNIYGKMCVWCLPHDCHSTIHYITLHKMPGVSDISGLLSISNSIKHCWTAGPRQLKKQNKLGVEYLPGIQFALFEL